MTPDLWRRQQKDHFWRVYFSTLSSYKTLYPVEAKMGLCDKCGSDVDPKNDAINFDFILTRNPALVTAQSRHLLPVYDEKRNLLCEGSPSRAQYIAEIPSDTRGYTYRPELALQYQEAYRELQKRF